ncbi:Transcriptional regulator, PadR family [Lachnospiraceae bacterium TWA4]|nr:Transcriptional regulator, PadR family [Lachnospiraceae bacterium TWA4]
MAKKTIKNHLTIGITDYLLLSVLNTHDSYAYEITKLICDYSDNLLPITNNAVYTSIYKLTESKMISDYSKLVGKRRTRVYYHLEPNGKEYLDLLEEEYSSMVLGVKKFFTRLNEEKEDCDE